MNPTTNPTTNPTVRASADDPAEDLRWAVSLVEDWLLHASPETLDELADFAYGPAGRGHDHIRWIVELLGETAARLRLAPQPPNQSCTAHCCTADREPSQ